MDDDSRIIKPAVCRFTKWAELPVSEQVDDVRIDPGHALEGRLRICAAACLSVGEKTKDVPLVSGIGRDELWHRVSGHAKERVVEENDEELINFLTVYLSHGNRYWAMRNEKIDYDPDAENWTGDTVTQDYVRTLPANENAEIKRTSFGEVMGKIFKSATGTETETSEKKSDSGIKIILAIVAFVAIIGATFYFRKKF